MEPQGEVGGVLGPLLSLGVCTDLTFKEEVNFARLSMIPSLLISGSIE